MKALVTGGAGFIGSNLVRRLLRDGHSVRVADNLLTGRMANLEGVLDRIDFRKVDLANPESALQVADGVDCIFHQAALPSVPRSVEDPLSTTVNCVMATVNVLVAAHKAGVRRVVYAASSSAYGDAEGMPRVETITPAPISPYAAAKLAGEYYCRAFTKVYGLETVALRYFNIFGPRQDPASEYAAVVPRFIAALLNGGEVTIHGDGEQTRDFTYIDNALDANVLAATSPQASGHVMNVATGHQYSINCLLETLEEIVGAKARRVHLPPRPGDARHSLADISLARKLMGYQPSVSFRDGLQRTVRWMRDGVDA